MKKIKKMSFTRQPYRQAGFVLIGLIIIVIGILWSNSNADKNRPNVSEPRDVQLVNCVLEDWEAMERALTNGASSYINLGEIKAKVNRCREIKTLPANIKQIYAGIYNLENKINELDEEYRLFVKVHGLPPKKIEKEVERFLIGNLKVKFFVTTTKCLPPIWGHTKGWYLICDGTLGSPQHKRHRYYLFYSAGKIITQLGF